MKRFLVGLLMIGAVALGQAQTGPAEKPDFSGSWKLNVSKSEFGQVPPPSSETDVVMQMGDDFNVVVKQTDQVGDQNYTLTFKAGGAESPMSESSFAAGSEFKIVNSKAEWAGATLVLTHKAIYQGGPLDISTRWTLSDNGKVMTKITSYTLSQGTL
jgi:hypothetical protein